MECTCHPPPPPKKSNCFMSIAEKKLLPLSLLCATQHIIVSSAPFCNPYTILHSFQASLKHRAYASSCSSSWMDDCIFGWTEKGSQCSPGGEGNHLRLKNGRPRVRITARNFENFKIGILLLHTTIICIVMYNAERTYIHMWRPSSSGQPKVCTHGW
jgi:hypothetical protein